MKFLDKTGLDTLWAKIKSTFQTLGNLVTSWSGTPSDTKYPSEKLVKTALDGKQNSLPTSGTASDSYAINITGNAATATSSNNTKVTTATTTKTYLAGANATGYASGNQTSLLTDTGIYATTNPGELNATQFKINEHCTVTYNDTRESVDFTFS